MRTPDHPDDSRKKVSRGAVGAAQREEKCCDDSPYGTCDKHFSVHSPTEEVQELEHDQFKGMSMRLTVDSFSPMKPVQDSLEKKRQLFRAPFSLPESREGDSWEDYMYAGWGNLDQLPAIIEFVSTKKAEWGNEVADIFIKSCTVHKKEARTLALQEAASAVRGMKESGKYYPPEASALGDAAREIESKITK